MSAATFNLVIEQNSDFSLSVDLNDGAQPTPAPIDLSNCAIYSVIRESQLSPVLASFNVAITDAVNGMFRLWLDHSTTLSLPITTSSSLLKYDVLLVKPDQSHERLFEGSVAVSEATTLSA
jgi:hypothetical protein